MPYIEETPAEVASKPRTITPLAKAVDIKSIVIEKNIPLPARGRREIDRGDFYSTIEVGDSFVVPHRAFVQHAMQWGRKNDRKFVSRIVDEDAAEKTYRVWRTA